MTPRDLSSLPPGRAPLFDPTLRRAALATAGTGLCLAVGVGLWAGGRAAAGTAIGSALAVSNVATMAWLGRGMMESRGGLWSLLGAVKMGVLFGLVAWLLRHEIVRVLPFALGYASLPVGAVLAVLTEPAPPDDPPVSP